ncbi:MAG: VanZ family protein [Magnetococcales bacterium]|nr:VanZ family protein [Magnetococcales bacterium]
MSAGTAPPPPFPLFPHADKVAHAIVYGGLALIAFESFRRWQALQSHALRWSWLFTTLYGASDEWHQSFVAGRYSDGWDLLADSLGGLIALVIYHAYNRRKQGLYSRSNSNLYM